jgi:hypothetical protein
MHIEGNAGKHVIWLEVDGSSQWQSAWTKRLKERLKFIRSGAFARTFGAAGPLVCYVVFGQTAAAGERRQQQLCRWTMAALQELGLKESWAGIFRFTSVMSEEGHEYPLFTGDVWYTPDAPSTPVPLFVP